MKHIIFVYPPFMMLWDAKAGRHFDWCLGSAYCISYLVQNGFRAEPFLTNEPVNVSEGVKQILAKNPKVVGFTVYDSNYRSSQLIARSLKKAAPGIIIVFGGPTPSVQSKPILKMNDFVDICVRHEGEETCLELLSLLDNVNFRMKKASGFLDKIKGITYRLDNVIRENPARDILLASRKVRNFLDKYPSPYLSGLLDSSKLGIITARGCNRNCTYCNCAIISKRIISTHSTDRVIEELDYISKKIGPAGLVNIFDDAFTLLPGRALEICNKIIENKIKLPFSCTTRYDRVNEELLEKMKEAGFKTISFSLESAVPRLLRIIGKVRSPNTAVDPNFEKEKEFIEKFKKYTTYAKKIGIQAVNASIMIGLPTETQEEGQQTIDMIRSLGNCLNSYSHNIFQILPGTPVFFNHEELGMKLVKFDNQVHYRTIHPYDTGSIKPAPGSHLEEVAANQDRFCTRSLALCTSNKSAAGFFSIVILWADIISEDLVYWLQENLAVSGTLIQVYSNLDSVRRHHEDNQDKLYKYIAPTLFHPVFYQTAAKNGAITLNPSRMKVYDKQLGIRIKLVNTKNGLRYPGSPIDPLQTICIEKEKEDVLQLYRFLAHLADKDNAAEDLFNGPFIPYISGLCRWGKKTPNCQSLETVIVDSQNNVKTCWHGSPIGRVGMAFSELWENLQGMGQAVENERDCRICKKQHQCTGCLFPHPLLASEYCDLKKNGDTVESAELISTFDSFKEL